MTALEVKNYIETLCSHLTFKFNSKNCGIDPLAVDNFEMWYGEKTMTVKSIDEVMNTAFFDGKTLNEIADILKFD